MMASLDSTPLTDPKVEPFDTVTEIAAGTSRVKTVPDVSVEDRKSSVHGFSVTVSALEPTDAETLASSV